MQKLRGAVLQLTLNSTCFSIINKFDSACILKHKTTDTLVDYFSNTSANYNVKRKTQNLCA